MAWPCLPAPELPALLLLALLLLSLLLVALLPLPLLALVLVLVAVLVLDVVVLDVVVVVAVLAAHVDLVLEVATRSRSVWLQHSRRLPSRLHLHLLRLLRLQPRLQLLAPQPPCVPRTQSRCRQPGTRAPIAGACSPWRSRWSTMS